ncbi:MAG: hypothetical protein MRZ79_12070 [Bacteroidia bacterium]|nr:hypothetical protein [Bacteroidia bacterium]
MRKPALFIILLSSVLFFFGCDPEEKHETTEPKHKEAEKAEPKEEEKKKPSSKDAKLKKIINDYYKALEKEDPYIVDYYAPVIQKFYSAENVKQSRVKQSLQQSFKAVNNRKVSIDWESLEVINLDSQIVARFKGKTSYEEVKSGRKKNASFYNQLTFDEEYRIVKYEDAKTAPAHKVKETVHANTVEEAIKIVTKAIKSGKPEELKAVINPELGFFYIDRPGVWDVPKYLEDPLELKRHSSWVVKQKKSFCPNLTNEELPAYDCEEEFSKSGCFYYVMDNKNSPFNRISKSLEVLRSYGGAKKDKQPLSKAKTIELSVSYELIDTESSSSFIFGRIEGKWWLFVIDLANYDCSV